jgi:hypothetical protein
VHAQEPDSYSPSVHTSIWSLTFCFFITMQNNPEETTALTAQGRSGLRRFGGIPILSKTAAGNAALSNASPNPPLHSRILIPISGALNGIVIGNRRNSHYLRQFQ